MDSQLPELPKNGATFKQAMNETVFTADQMRSYALLAIKEEREALLRLIREQTHPVAEFLYGHTRAQAVEWAKEDKYDSDAYKAGEILSILAAAIRGEGK